MATFSSLRLRRLKSLLAIAAASPLENSDLLTLTDEGELAAPLPFSLIEYDEDLLTITDSMDSANILIGEVFTTKTLMIAELRLTSGTQYKAAKGVRHPSRMYVGRVKSFGSIIRSMAVPAGIPHIGDAEIVIEDLDGVLRAEADATSIKNREVILKIGSEGESEKIFQLAYTGKISTSTFGPGLAKIKLKDNTFQFFDEQLPDLLTRDNFLSDPLFARNLIARTEGRFDEKEIFSPIVFGIMDSATLDVMGSVNAVRLDSTTFNLAQHPIPHTPIKIFVKDPSVGDTSFVQQVGGFSIVEVAKTIDDVAYIFTHVVFGSARSDGFEVRWDGEGMTDDGTKTGTVVRNPSTAIKLYLTRIAQQDETTQLDLANFAAVATLLDAVSTGGTVSGLFCDGAITQRMSHKEAISRLTRSFGLFIFTNKNGLISLRYIDAEDLTRLVLDDVQDIYLKSELHSLAGPVFNQVDLQHTRSFSDQSWNAQLTVTDDLAVTELGRVESKDLKLFFVRDDFVGDKIARNFLQFVNPRSYRIMFTVPGHRRTRDIELGQLIGITNYSGIDASGGGYLNKEFLIHKTEFATDSKQLRVHAVARREAPSIGVTESTSIEFITIQAGNGLLENGLWLELTGRAALNLGFVNPTVLPFTPKWVTVEIDTNFGGSGVNTPSYALVDLGKGSPGSEEVVLESLIIVTDETGVDGHTSRNYSFPYAGWVAGDRLFARCRDDLNEVAVGTHQFNIDVTLWR